MRKYYRYTRRKITKESIRKLFLDENESPKNKALSVFIGVFIGILPIVGAQVLLAIATTHIFNVNKPLAVVGTHINFTPLYPVIVYLSLKVGAFISGDISSIPELNEISFNSAKTYFWLYLLGCVPIAIATALLFGIITYFIAVYYKHSNKTVSN
jgi:uncharacterized protein (DUF2062 family)